MNKKGEKSKIKSKKYQLFLKRDIGIILSLTVYKLKNRCSALNYRLYSGFIDFT